MVQKLLVSVAPLECLTPQWHRGAVKRRGKSTTRSTFQSLMVKPATLRVRARPSADGLEASPITEIIMRMSTSWLRSLEL